MRCFVLLLVFLISSFSALGRLFPYGRTLTLSVSGDLGRTGNVNSGCFRLFLNIAQGYTILTNDGKMNYHEPINDLIPYTESTKKYHFKIILLDKKYAFKKSIHFCSLTRSQRQCIALRYFLISYKK